MNLRLAVSTGALTIFLVFASGCGYIADRDQLPIATWDGKEMTAWKFKLILRNMSDEDRPLIQNKADLIRAIEKHIDDELKTIVAKQLESEGRLPPMRDPARAVYFQKYPEYRDVYFVPNLALIDMTEQEWAVMKEAIEIGIDLEEAALKREQAVRILAADYAARGLIRADEAEYQREYELRKDVLVRPEGVVFKAIRIPISAPDAVKEIAEVRRRIDDGEPFDRLLEEYGARNPEFALDTAFDYDPGRPQFESFWAALKDAQPGAIIGPVLLPSYQEQGIDLETGQITNLTRPAAHLVVQVAEYRPQRTMTLEEAKPLLINDLLYRKMMERLREDHAVQIYEDNLWNPSGFGDQYKDQTIKTTLD